jgi:hypothetical protein
LSSPYPHSWNSFNMSHFSTFIHNKYIVFPIPFPYILPPPTGTNPQIRTVLPSCSLFLKKDIFVCLR